MAESGGGNSFEDNGAGNGASKEACSVEAAGFGVSKAEEETRVGERGGGRWFW